MHIFNLIERLQYFKPTNGEILRVHARGLTDQTARYLTNIADIITLRIGY